MNTDEALAAGIAKFLKEANAKAPGSVFTEFSSPLSVDVIPTGALSLDFALGAGGIPRGRIIELYGPEGSGKTSLALSVCANAIRLGHAAGYVDVENALTFDHVKWMGVDTKYFVVAQPDSAEAALQEVERMCNSLLYGVVVVDSVASLTPQAELNGEIGDQNMALVARLLSPALRRLQAVAHRTNTALIFINQLREKPGVSFGNPEYTPGGKALKFYASVRLEVRSSASKQIKQGTGSSLQVVGQVCKVVVKKNKVGTPFKEAEYRLMYNKGIDSSAAIMDVAVELGVWDSRPGGTYFDVETGEQIGRGKDAVQALLTSDPVLAAAVTEKITAVIRASRVELDADVNFLPDPPEDFLEEGDLAGPEGPDFLAALADDPA